PITKRRSSSGMSGSRASTRSGTARRPPRFGASFSPIESVRYRFAACARWIGRRKCRCAQPGRSRSPCRKLDRIRLRSPSTAPARNRPHPLRFDPGRNPVPPLVLDLKLAKLTEERGPGDPEEGGRVNSVASGGLQSAPELLLVQKGLGCLAAAGQVRDPIE